MSLEIILEYVIIGLMILNLIVTMAKRKPPVQAAVVSQEKPASNKPQLSAAKIAELEKQAEASYYQAVQEGIHRFGGELDQTSERLNQLISRLTTQVTQDELQKFHTGLDAAREETVKVLGDIQKAIVAREQQLLKDLDVGLAEHRKLVAEQLDKKLGAAVMSYVIEALGQGADLGAQKSYILASLERHKADIIKDLNNGK